MLFACGGRGQGSISERKSSAVRRGEAGCNFAAFRVPAKEGKRGKRTFADYGFKAPKVDEKDAIIETTAEVKRLVIKVLDQKPSGLYVCVAELGQSGEQIKTQSVILLKRKDQNALLRGRESFREFAACPVIGGTDSTADSYGGD